MKMTEHKKVLRILIGGSQKWYATYDFVGNTNGTFLSHRGPARISELASKYPEMIQTDATEKVYKYRFKFDNSYLFLQILPKDLADFVREEMSELGHSYQEDKQHVEIRGGVAHIGTIIETIHAKNINTSKKTT